MHKIGHIHHDHEGVDNVSQDDNKKYLTPHIPMESTQNGKEHIKADSGNVDKVKKLSLINTPAPLFYQQILTWSVIVP